MHPTFNEEMKRRFGKKMYKLSFDAGMTCPNRDGSLGIGGCIFCDQGGSGDFAVKINTDELNDDSWNDAFSKALSKISGKIKHTECGFIAYFQAHTNTYDSIDRLNRLYSYIIKRPEISALSIATRPDCLGSDVIALLSRLNQIKPVWIELGLQTIHEQTAKSINRCYNLSTFETALDDLRNSNIECIVHVILGLPGESRQMMLETIRYLSQKDIQGIKLSMLHILKNTKLAELYEKDPFPIFSLEEYASLLNQCLEILPDTITIHRLTGDGNKKNLIAPLWSGDKKKVLNRLYSLPAFLPFFCSK